MKRLAAMGMTALLIMGINLSALADSALWTPEKANQWYSEIGWQVGCNFGPSTAINETARQNVYVSLVNTLLSVSNSSLTLLNTKYQWALWTNSQP
ncbi:MAG: hypothetical protein P9L94_13880 [Candidatus Hinthialibacter antarcticus]|nr:hypothetical protein [Candidatus Hinthialibacter antarcticus]